MTFIMWSILLLFSNFLISLVASTHTRDLLQCLSLQSHLSKVIYTPENSSYTSIFHSGMQNPRAASFPTLKPLAIVTPNQESQVQSTIVCAKEHAILIRVRSGGHDFEGLSYISQVPFVIIDLRNMRSISINTDTKTAWIQAGATLGELYYKIAQESKTLAFVAGSCPTVGVGGHISGGGYGMMSRKFGLATDNVIDARIINARGMILDKKSMGEDVFWAIRGGGGASFGVIVAWEVRLNPIRENVTVFNVTRTSEQDAISLIHRWQYIADNIDENLLIRIFIHSIKSPQTGNRTIQASFTSLFLGPVDELLPIMAKSFPEIGLTKEDCTEMSWIQSTLYFAYYPSEKLTKLLVRHQPYPSYKVKSDFVNQPISENDLERIYEWLNEEDESKAGLQFSPYGGKISEISKSDTAFPHRYEKLYMIEYSIKWYDQGNVLEANRHLKWMREFHVFMEPFVTKSPRSAYYNYRDLDLGRNNNQGNTSYLQAKIWGEKYFKNNFDRLVQTKTKFDPSDFFWNEQSIPPLKRVLRLKDQKEKGKTDPLFLLE